MQHEKVALSPADLKGQSKPEKIIRGGFPVISVTRLLIFNSTEWAARDRNWTRVWEEESICIKWIPRNALGWTWSEWNTRMKEKFKTIQTSHKRWNAVLRPKFGARNNWLSTVKVDLHWEKMHRRCQLNEGSSLTFYFRIFAICTHESHISVSR